MRRDRRSKVDQRGQEGGLQGKEGMGSGSGVQRLQPINPSVASAEFGIVAVA